MAKITIEELIDKYPKIFVDYEGNPGRCNWTGVPKAWLPIIDILCDSIQSYIDDWNRYTFSGDKKVEQITCFQMKEKFGRLRFYTDGNADKKIQGMILMAEHMCSNICENCGTEEDLGVTSRWVTIVCKTCAESINRGEWSPRKK